jgi:hypothetical protein
MERHRRISWPELSLTKKAVCHENPVGPRRSTYQATCRLIAKESKSDGKIAAVPEYRAQKEE